MKRTDWVLLLLLAGCAAPGPAPVLDRVAAGKPKAEPLPPKPAPRLIEASRNGSHTVQKGETLYAIAFANNLDHRDLTLWNNLPSPDVIKVGQVLRLTPPVAPVSASKEVEVRPLPAERPIKANPLIEPPLLREPQVVLIPYSDAEWAELNAKEAGRKSEASETETPGKTEPAAKAPTPPQPELPARTEPPVASPGATQEGEWRWPARGNLIRRFGEAGSKGIDIAGERNGPVLAVAAGRVVYSGAGLRGYGRLLIIKHPGEFLSAYAHNQETLVKEGDNVVAGQKIALMGDSDADQIKLHFEIRQYGRPLDPLKYLPERP